MRNLERVLAIVASAVGAGSVIVGFIVWSASISPHLQTLDDRTKALDEHVAKIDESRTIGLQRLSTVEEAVRSQRDILADIRAKLDQALMRRR